MLTVDLVTARRRGDRLHVTALSAEKRRTAALLAEKYLQIMKLGQGLSRADLEEKCAAIHVHPRDKKLADGLLKLVNDRCEYDVQADIDPKALRQELFELAAQMRKDATDLSLFQREEAVERVAQARSLAPEDIESLLFADLKDAHTLLGFKSLETTALVALYEQSLNQAVLLKAVKINLDVHASSPEVYRQLFFKLKFLGLLHTIRRTDQGFHIEIDGPYSLFGSSTKYGLKLALIIPILALCDRWKLKANIIWGKDKQPLDFVLEKKRGRKTESTSAAQREPLPEHIAKLIQRWDELKSPWQISEANHILDLPGIGLCIPDLIFKHSETGAEVFFEVMGFWSRDAVWRRVELVEAGLPYNVIFAVSSRLRVSEAVLDQELPSSLYVYKGTMNPKRISELLPG